MKATVTIAALFAVLFAFYYVVDLIVGLGMDPIGEADDAALMEPIDGVFVPPVRR